LATPEVLSPNAKFPNASENDALVAAANAPIPTPVNSLDAVLFRFWPPVPMNKLPAADPETAFVENVAVLPNAALTAKFPATY
jgi:hypothetical protein